MLNSIIKDLKVNLLDGKQMLLIIAMPVVLTVILSFALGGTFSDYGLTEPINIAVVCEYDSEVNVQDVLADIDGIDFNNLPNEATQGFDMALNSFFPEQILFDEFLDSNDVKKMLSYKKMTRSKADEAISNNEISAIIVVPENFLVGTYKNLFGYKTTVEFEVVTRANSTYRGDIVKEITSAFTDMFSSSFVNNEVYKEVGAKYSTQEQIMRNIGVFYENMNGAGKNAVNEINIETVKRYEVVDSFTYYTAAMLCMFLLYSAGIGGRSMLEEKENLTYDRMKVLGVTYLQMMVSKAVVVFVICLVQTLVMIGLSSIAFGVQWGNILMIAAIAVCSSIAVGGLGSFIGAISLRSKNYKVANAFDGAIVQVLALFGGSYIPLSVLPKFFTKVSNFTLNGEALKAYVKAAQGMGFDAITSELGVILIFGLVFFLAAILLLNIERRKENADTHLA